MRSSDAVAVDAVQARVEAQELAGRQLFVDEGPVRNEAERCFRRFRVRRQIVSVDEDAAGGRFQQAGDHADGGGLARAVRAEESVNLAGRHLERDAVHGGKAAVLLDEIVNGDHGRRRRCAPAPSAPGRRRGERGHVGNRRADQDRRRAGREIEVEHRHLQTADQRQDHRLPVEAAAREPQVRRVGGKLVERRINRQPQAAARSFIQIHLGPRVVVERAAHVDETDRNPGRDARPRAPSPHTAPCARCSRRPWCAAPRAPTEG